MAKKRRLKTSEKQAFTVRCPAPLLRKFDKQAGAMDLSRQQLIERMIRLAVAFEDKSGSGLFLDELTKQIEETVERAIEQAARDGVISK